MKPSHLFLNHDDFSNRFKETYIYYRDVPKFVHSCTMINNEDLDTLAFNAFDFKSGLNFSSKIQVILLNDPDVNFRQYKLGYSSYSEIGAMWISRAPARQWKQGLRKDQCHVLGYHLENEAQNSTLYPGEFTYQMLTGAYPSIEHSLNRMGLYPSKTVKIPIHKDFALIRRQQTKTVGVEYKGMLICPLIDTGFKPEISSEFRYLLNIPEYAKLLNQVLSSQ